MCVHTHFAGCRVVTVAGFLFQVAGSPAAIIHFLFSISRFVLPSAGALHVAALSIAAYSRLSAVAAHLLRTVCTISAGYMRNNRFRLHGQ